MTTPFLTLIHELRRTDGKGERRAFAAQEHKERSMTETQQITDSVNRQRDLILAARDGKRLTADERLHLERYKRHSSPNTRKPERNDK